MILEDGESLSTAENAINILIRSLRDQFNINIFFHPQDVLISLLCTFILKLLTKRK